MGVAARAIQYGEADLMLAGGSEAAVTPMAIGGFASMGALSARNDSPETRVAARSTRRATASCSARARAWWCSSCSTTRSRRGARIYAELAGYAATGDAYHLTGQPDAHEGLQRAMRRALRDANVAPEEVDY
jgi:3-oxoacyl-(acyl-carrier-protein) synthase